MPIFSDISACRFNSCLNGGTCTSYGNGTTYCECVGGFVGSLCQHEPIAMFGLEYVIVKDDKKSWTDAQAHCVQMGYNLTSVISEAEADFLRDFA